MPGTKTTSYFPPPRHDDMFCIVGAVRDLDRPEASMTEPWSGFEDEPLVEFMIERALVTLTTGRDGLSPGHTIWRAS